MADRRPLVTPGKIAELVDGDRAIVSGIVRTAAGDLTFEDSIAGSKTLAQLAAGGGGGGIGGTTGSTADRLVVATAVLDDVSTVTLTAGSVSTHIADTLIHVPALGTALQTLRVNAGATATEWATVVGTGDVIGPAGATDNAVARFDLATGKSIQNSVVTISDAGAATGFTTLGTSGAITAGGAVNGTNLSGTNTGDQTITLTGNVTGTGTGSFAATIANDAVTYAQIQNVSAADRLLGRGNGGGAGDVQEITLGTNLSMAAGVLNATGGSGEVNTSSNAGATGTGIALAKVGADLPFAKIDGVNGINESLISSVLTLDGVLLVPRDGSRAMTAALDMGGFAHTALGYRVISDTIAAQANNYNHGSLNTADELRITLTGSQLLTGITAPTTGGTTRKTIHNIDTADTLSIGSEHASSTAANRIITPNAATLLLPPGGSVELGYDSTSSRWRATAVNNGAIALPAPVLHEVSRSAQISNITTTPVFPGYDVTIKSINATYWSYSSGTWTCLVAHDSTIEAELSGQYSGAVSSQIYLDITYAQGGAYNLLYRQRTSCYSNITPDFFLRSSVTRSWVVNDTMRVYISCASGDADIFAASNLCRIRTA